MKGADLWPLGAAHLMGYRFNRCGADPHGNAAAAITVEGPTFCEALVAATKEIASNPVGCPRVNRTSRWQPNDDMSPFLTSVKGPQIVRLFDDDDPALGHRP